MYVFLVRRVGDVEEAVGDDALRIVVAGTLVAALVTQRLQVARTAQQETAIEHAAVAA